MSFVGRLPRSSPLRATAAARDRRRPVRSGRRVADECGVDELFEPDDESASHDEVMGHPHSQGLAGGPVPARCSGRARRRSHRRRRRCRRARSSRPTRRPASPSRWQSRLRVCGRCRRAGIPPSRSTRRPGRALRAGHPGRRPPRRGTGVVRRRPGRGSVDQPHVISPLATLVPRLAAIFRPASG